jgi:hypothetical protein
MMHGLPNCKPPPRASLQRLATKAIDSEQFAQQKSQHVLAFFVFKLSR